MEARVDSLYELGEKMDVKRDNLRARLQSTEMSRRRLLGYFARAKRELRVAQGRRQAAEREREDVKLRLMEEQAAHLALKTKHDALVRAHGVLKGHKPSASEEELHA